MCMLCVIQKWSRRIATMLPWLVIPLIGLWALSQLLPPAFHFEITSPRLACVLVLLITLFWYEVLMPQLSAWQSRRNARLRERMRCEAIELQKLRKTATRRCRNCLTPYRDQNPGGGKFMCSCCGHVSKRPVLDLPVPPEVCGGGSGLLRDVVGKGGRLLNGKQRVENGWFCGQEWMENGNLSGGPFSGKSSSWNLNGGWLHAGDEELCTANTAYSRAFLFVCKVVAACILSVVGLWRRIFGIGSSREDTSVDAEGRGMLDNRIENGANGQESRGDKARRKAEEKRQARLEKELLEEEERKQREEVARLVEERRRLRDVKIEAEKKEQGKGSPCTKERDVRKESERKRQERKKERERGSRSDADTEEVEKRAGKDGDMNKNRETQKVAPENNKAHGNEQGHGVKGSGAGSYNHGYSGARYFDRMRGTILSSSRVLTGGNFFSKSSPSVSREHKPGVLDDSTPTSGYKKDMVAQPEWISGRSPVGVGGGDNNVKHPHVIKEPQPSTPPPKKSWQQLFTRSAADGAATPPPSNSGVISRPIGKNQVESQEPPVSGVPTSTQLFNNPFSLPSFPFMTTSSNSSPLLSSQHALHKFGDPPRQFFQEESEIFEDPCYDPDPISLLGPVSESLDNFQLDLGFLNDTVLDKPRAVKTSSPEVSRPSSIGSSPLSRSRPSEDRFSGSFLFPSAAKVHEYPNNVTHNVTGPTWSATSLSPDAHGIGVGPGWLLPPSELNLMKDNAVRSVPPQQKTMASLFKKDGQAFSNTHTTQSTVFGNSLNGGSYNTSVPDGVQVPWLPPSTLFSASGPENHSLLKPKEDLLYRNAGTSAANHRFEMSGANSWAKQDGAVHGSRDVTGNSPMMNNRGHVGGLYSSPDVQPFWSYD